MTDGTYFEGLTRKELIEKIAQLMVENDELKKQSLEDKCASTSAIHLYEHYFEKYQTALEQIDLLKEQLNQAKNVPPVTNSANDYLHTLDEFTLDGGNPGCWEPIVTVLGETKFIRTK